MHRHNAATERLCQNPSRLLINASTQACFDAYAWNREQRSRTVAAAGSGGLGGGEGQVVFPANRANQPNVRKTWSESSVDMSQVDL